MSYGPIVVTSIATDAVVDSLKAATQNYVDGLAASDYELDPAALEAIAAATSAAASIVASGAIGAGPVNVTINGHANPGHVPVKGYANDVVTVSVSSAASLPAVASTA